MNKAFVKESDDETSPKCPACFAIGQPVGEATLTRHLIDTAGTHLAASSACFCPNPTCDVAYFDANRQTVGVENLRAPMWPKTEDAAAILCACMGVTVRELIDDARKKDPSRVRRILEEAKQHPQRCVELCIYAKTCVAEAQRVYLRNLGNVK